ncbi:MAG: hypothetical protein CM1200mP10_32260 [Candidatus Neomarinimicrobiota bacterium]|nr:MAG: hypothetical protein CM1200mP10_32260 [Candidatus Neomarinimicrobiota bacterium]
MKIMTPILLFLIIFNGCSDKAQNWVILFDGGNVISGAVINRTLFQRVDG